MLTRIIRLLSIWRIGLLVSNKTVDCRFALLGLKFGFGYNHEFFIHIAPGLLNSRCLFLRAETHSVRHPEAKGLATGVCGKNNTELTRMSTGRLIIVKQRSQTLPIGSDVGKVLKSFFSFSIVLLRRKPPN